MFTFSKSIYGCRKLNNYKKRFLKFLVKSQNFVAFSIDATLISRKNMSSSNFVYNSNFDAKTGEQKQNWVFLVKTQNFVVFAKHVTVISRKNMSSSNFVYNANFDAKTENWPDKPQMLAIELIRAVLTIYFSWKNH